MHNRNEDLNRAAFQKETRKKETRKKQNRDDIHAGDYMEQYQSPLGVITLASNGESLTGLWFEGQKYFDSSLSDPENHTKKALPVFDQTKQWLNLYFDGIQPDFTPPLTLEGTAFRQTVWNLLREIPYGQTRTYGAIAALVAKEKGLPRFSAQAVGQAVGRNPISLIVPCHRVVGANGSLTGYAGGLERKAWLLKLEGAEAGC